VEYTIIETDYNELDLRWIVVSNGVGAVWGAFATQSDAILFVIAAMYPGLAIDSHYNW
jgi:hypothetical protein